MKLTKTIIDGLSYVGDASKNERCCYWADEPTGFGLRVYPSGKKAFIHTFYFNGRKNQKTIGRYGDITLTKAIEIARKEKVMLLDGINPLDERKRSRLGDTIGKLCELYITKYATLKKTGDEDIRRINQHILPCWANRKIKSITREEVTALHTRMGSKTPYEANRILSLLSKLFTVAEREGLVDRGFPNAAHGVVKYKEESRDRFVTTEEMPRLIQAIQNEHNQYAKYALWLYLLTGLRKEELLSATWDSIDFDRMELRLADTKNSKRHYLPLSNAALAVLEQIPRVTNNPYIIVGKNEGEHLVNLDRAWNRVREEANMTDVHIHDLRRSVGSWMAQAGNSLHLIGKVLNHSNASTTAIYARFQQDHVRDVLNHHGDSIFRSGGINTTSSDSA